MICPNCQIIHEYDGHRDWPKWCRTCTHEAMRFAWLEFEQKYWSKWSNEEKYKHMGVYKTLKA